MKNANKLQKVLMTACLAVLVIFAGTIALRLFTRQVLIVGMGMDNAFTQAVFFDNEDMRRLPGYQAMVYGDTDEGYYDWASEYPFEDENQTSTDLTESSQTSTLNRYVKLIGSLEGKIENYTQDTLMGYTTITEIGSAYKKLIGWNFTSFGEYNGIYQLSDGYWTSLKAKKDMSAHIDAFLSLDKFCKEQNVDFLYVQAPYKVSKYEDTDVSGVVDFSNQNADEVLDSLQKAAVDTLDLREIIHQDGLSHHELFFVTDHHWKGETGLWAAGKIAGILNENYDFQINLELLNPDNFTSVIYEDYFLGSLGRKVTLGRAEPENISLLYPNYETMLHFRIPSIGIDQTGDFSITYNMEAVSEIDYYNKDPYHAYSYGDRALIQYKNLDKNIDESTKVLLVHDSFGDCMMSFLALGVANLDAIDLRYFTGSLETYIKETQPDVVILMYNIGELVVDVDMSDHTNLYDFR